MILYLGQGFMVGIWSQTKTAHLQLHHGGFIWLWNKFEWEDEVDALAVTELDSWVYSARNSGREEAG